VATSARLFKKYRIADPWDPGSEEPALPIALGPVSLRLGEKRRQPARHLKPRDPKKKQKPRSRMPSASQSQPSKPSSDGVNWPAGFKPPKVPQARPTREKGPPPPPPRPNSMLAREFGAAQKRPLVGKLPVRPDLAAAQKPGGPTASPSTSPPPIPGPRSTPRIPPPRREPAAMRRSPPSPPATPAPAAPEGDAISRRPPMPQRKSAPKKGGRMRMASTAVIAAPVVREMPSPPPNLPESVAAPPTTIPAAAAAEAGDAPPKPKPASAVDRMRALRQRSSADSMDDLFDFAAQEGRIRLGRRKPATETPPSGDSGASGDG
ncbi:MAG: hypothetical protein AAFV53_30190, partial [Myxococcota bacterium]